MKRNIEQKNVIIYEEAMKNATRTKISHDKSQQL